MELNEVAGKRHRIITPEGNAYLFVSENDIQLTVADENSPKQREIRAATEALCRLASKAMKAGLPMLQIAEQFEKADMGRYGLLSEVAAKMREFAK
jgi:hypothetical protein